MKPNFRLAIISILIFYSFSSCEGIVGDRGVVYANDSDDALDSVMVVLYVDKVKSDTTFTDENGSFVSTQFVGCVPDCPDVQIEFIKTGFKTLLIDPAQYRSKKAQPNGSMKIILERK